MAHRTDGAGARVLTIPNLLSAFRLCLIPLILWLYGTGRSALWAGGALVLSGLTDVADGWVARKFHMGSGLGKVLDPLADKLTQGAVLACLVFRYPWMLLPLLLLLVKETAVAVSGWVVLKKTGRVEGADWHGKAATCLLYATLLLHLVWDNVPPLASGLAILACAGMTALSLVLYLRRNRKALAQSKL